VKKHIYKILVTRKGRGDVDTTAYTRQAGIHEGILAIWGLSGCLSIKIVHYL
jgi:hypothetical protein